MKAVVAANRGDDKPGSLAPGGLTPDWSGFANSRNNFVKNEGNEWHPLAALLIVKSLT